MRGVKWGPQGNRIVAAESMWKQPLKWNREAAARLANHKRACDMCNSEYDVPDPYERPRVFCASLADVFEDWQGPMMNSSGRQLHISPSGKWCPDGLGSPVDDHGWKPLTMQDVRERLFRLIDATPNLDWLLLTKRPENITKMMPARFRWVETGRKIWQLESPVGSRHFHGIVFGDSDQPSFTLPCGFTVSNSNGLIEERGAGQRQTRDACKAEVERLFQTARPNLWLGVSVENQQTADERIPHLLRVPSAVRFLSAEPLLGRLELYARGWLTGRIPGQCGSCVICRHPVRCRCPGDGFPSVDWVIVGGESGPGARPCQIDWLRSLVKQCKNAGTACFVKQAGARPLVTYSELCDLKPNPPAVDCAPTTLGILPLRDKKGGDLYELPPDLRVREFPTPTVGVC